MVLCDPRPKGSPVGGSQPAGDFFLIFKDYLIFILSCAFTVDIICINLNIHTSFYTNFRNIIHNTSYFILFSLEQV
jgi:hypothetical protein